MPSFERKVNLRALVEESTFSLLLPLLLRKIRVEEFSYHVEVFHYLPAVEGRFDGKHEDCFPSEPEELEFAPIFDIAYVAFQMTYYLKCEVNSRVEGNLAKKLCWKLIDFYAEKLQKHFIKQETTWLDSCEAYAKARIAVEDSRKVDYE